jgi:hypothetical protein
MKVVATPAMQLKFKQLALDPMPLSPTGIDKYVAAERRSNEKLIKAACIE